MRRARWLMSAGFALSQAVLLGCQGNPDPPQIPYAQSSEQYSDKMDLARLEHELPLTPADLMKITPENLKGATQEQVDQIYARLTAGPIPDGAYDGRMFFPKGSSERARLAEIVGGGIKGFIVDRKAATLEHIGEFIWKGKVFYRNDGVLRNRIQDLLILKPIVGPNVEQIQKIDVDGKDAWLLFPAKLYCGQSLLDGRRESVIIDYAFTDDLPGYREMPDVLAGREGLDIRDEIRMVRPGFYLGRAYIKKVFALNFTLYNKAVAEKESPAFASSGSVAEDCWVGNQRLPAMAHKPSTQQARVVETH
ncbi:MAG: hypothetical protein CAF42_003755 [Nitrospira sp. CG24B]|nr:MAG: hypothetical protein CAF42_003755 [Nitrospira sp. CG24B]